MYVCCVQIMKFKAKDLEINMLRSLGVAGDLYLKHWTAD